MGFMNSRLGIGDAVIIILSDFSDLSEHLTYEECKYIEEFVENQIDNIQEEVRFMIEQKNNPLDDKKIMLAKSLGYIKWTT